MKRICYVILCVLIFSSCNPSGNIQEVECNPLKNTRQTVLQGINFGDPLDSVKASMLFDTLSLCVTYSYKDTCYSFISLFGGSPARFYLSFRDGKLIDVQLRVPNSGYLSSLPPDTLRAYEDGWKNAVTSVYGSSTKILFDKRGDYYWVWHICNGPIATMRSLNIMNRYGEATNP